MRSGQNMCLRQKNYIIHPPPRQWASCAITPIDPLSTPAIQATGLSPGMDVLSREPRHGPYYNELRRTLNQIQNYKHAWHFVSPVSKDKVPDYYNIIASVNYRRKTGR